MTRDDLDRVASELFRAARDERPRAGAREQARRAARRAVATPSARPARWVGLALAALVATLALAYARRHPEQTVQLTPDPAQVAPSARPAEPPRPVLSASAAPAPSVPARTATPPMTLEDELSQLQTARTALVDGDPAAALRQLNAYQRRGTRLRAEATLLRIEALARLGRSADAAALAARFVEQNPTNPLVDRARTFMSTPSDRRLPPVGGD